MFNTIKSKILLITFLMLLALSIVLSVFSYIFYNNSKSLIIKSCSHTIGQFVQNINKDIIKIENNARDLALNGELHYHSARRKDVFEDVTKRVFENYPDSLGGGIWFKPYVILKKIILCLCI